MKERISFVFYKDWHDLLKDEEEDVRLRLYDAITQYAFEGILPQDKSINMAFKLIRAAIDRDVQKFDDKVEKRKAAGRMGAQKTNSIRWGDKSQQSQQSSAKSANGDNCQQSQQSSAKSALNENGNENGNENVLQDTNVSMCSIITSPSNEEDVLQSIDSNSSKSVRYDVFVKLWNEKIKGTAHHAITDIKEGTQRRTWVSARIKEYGVEAVNKVICNAAASSFLNGNNKKGVIYGFDWVMRPNNFPKVLEGNYNDPAEIKPIPQPSAPASKSGTVQTRLNNDAAYYEWCKANGKNPDDPKTGTDYFKQNSQI